MGGGIESDTELMLHTWRSSLRCGVSSCMDVCVLRFQFCFIFQAGCRPPGWLSRLRCPRWYGVSGEIPFLMVSRPVRAERPTAWAPSNDGFERLATALCLIVCDDDDLRGTQLTF